MQMVLAKQKELEEKRRKKKEEEKQREEEEERRRLLDEESKRRLGSIRNNKESQYQTQFANNDPNEKTTMAEERRKHAEEKRKAYEEEKLRLQREEEGRRRQKEKEAMLLKKAALEEKKRLLLEEMAQRKAKEAALRKEAAYKEKLDRWKSKYQKVSLPTGQKFLDKSTETKILDLNTKSENAEKSQSNDKIVEVATTTTSSPEKIAENELENRVGSSVGGSSSLSEVKQNKKIGNPFTQEVCETLRVPCRWKEIYWTDVESFFQICDRAPLLQAAPKNWVGGETSSDGRKCGSQVDLWTLSIIHQSIDLRFKLERKKIYGQ